MDPCSSGLNLQSLGLSLKPWQCVVLDSATCTAHTFLVVFSGRFNHCYSDFLSLLVLCRAPWFAIFSVDWLLRRGRYDAPALLATRGGRYYRSGGVHLPGVVARVVGMAASAMWIDAPAFAGPLSSAAHGSDFSVFTGLLAAGLVCLLPPAARARARRPAWRRLRPASGRRPRRRWPERAPLRALEPVDEAGDRAPARRDHEELVRADERGDDREPVAQRRREERAGERERPGE